MSNIEQYATAQQLAEMLGLSKSGFYALYKRGDIPKGVKIGHSRRWKVSDFQRWLEDKEGAIE